MNKFLKILSATFIIPFFTQAHENITTQSGLEPEKFIATSDGDSVSLFVLQNSAGMEVCVTNFGGRIVSISVPDVDGKPRDVVLGFDNIESYFPQNNQSDFGAAIGRYANRIANGRCTIDGDTVVLPRNNFGHCLHGGPTGWQYKTYRVVSSNDSSIVMALRSPDGDNGFPGNVDAQVSYTLTNDNSLRIDYSAVTDRPTVINMTNHSYFNLSGDPSKPVSDHILEVNASRFTPVDSTFMTTGEILEVEGTPLDFRKPIAVGERIDDTSSRQIANANGYDHNWVLDTQGSLEQSAAVLLSPLSGIRLTVYTTEPGIQIYSGNFLDGSMNGKNGVRYNKRSGICLETQKYPDSPNKPAWPSPLLRPGEKYNSTTVFRFDTAAH